MATAVLVVTALFAAQQQFKAGRIAEAEGVTAAASEELAAEQREADRKGRLATALASQRAAAGASGISAFEGSPLTIATEDIRRERVATERDVFQSRISAFTQRARGRTARSAGTAQSLLTLTRGLGAAATVAE